MERVLKSQFKGTRKRFGTNKKHIALLHQLLDFVVASHSALLFEPAQDLGQEGHQYWTVKGKFDKKFNAVTIFPTIWDVAFEISALSESDKTCSSSFTLVEISSIYDSLAAPIASTYSQIVRDKHFLTVYSFA
mmetsp:Transcript_34647/g.89875  ORF Transcript_34647/g.89875 Transcript_34647/m.89875 type:complete len:133 (-) Transcript_34647:3154-3552(-)